MSSICVGDLAELSALSRFGEFDYAVPIDWVMVDPEARRPHVWFYPATDKRHRHGRPLSWKAMARLAIRRMRKTDAGAWKYASVWAIAYPGRPLDSYGLMRCRQWHGTDEMIRRNLELLGVPCPPEIPALAA